MQVTYVETTCHCDEQGFEALVYDEQLGDFRPALEHEDPILRLKCATCHGTRRVRVAAHVDRPPVKPLSATELAQAWAAVDQRELRVHEFWTRMAPHVRRAQLRAAQRQQRLIGLEACQRAYVAVLEQTGEPVSPGELAHREELRAQVRGLLPATT